MLLKNKIYQLFRSGTSPVGSLRFDHLLVVLIIAVFIAGSTGCASKKNLTSPTSTEKNMEQKVAQAKSDLLKIINDDGSMTYREKEQLLNNIIAMDLNDPEVNNLIAEAQEKLNYDRAEMERLKAEELRAKEEAMASEEETYVLILQDAFQSIANSSSIAEADMFAQSALKLFANPDVPVLIVIMEEGNIVDYDKPTTIQKYLDYLKDTKNNQNVIKNAVYNDNQLITELELIKRQ